MSAMNVMSIKRLLGMPLTFTFTDMTQITDVVAGTVSASKAVVVDANKDVTGLRNVTATGTLTFGTLGTTGIGGIQNGITATALTANANTTYANVVGLSATLVAGATYKFRAVLPSTVASGTGGIKYCFKYTTATLTSLEATAKGFTASAVAVQHTTTATDQADLYSSATVTILTEIEGTLVVNAGGTLNIQMAQAASNASNTVALVGGTLEFIRIA